MARQRGNLWQADVREADGKRLRPTFKTEEAAEAWEKGARRAVTEGKPLPPHKDVSRRQSERDLHLLGPLFDFVSRTEWAGRKSAHTLITNARNVVDYFGRNKEVGSITAADIADLKVDLADAGAAPATVNRKVAALSRMLRIAKDNDVIAAVPRIRWNPVAKTRFRYIDDTEEKAILSYWTAMGFADYTDLTAVLVDTGARCYSEMIPVKWDAFGPNYSSVSFWHTKTNKPRTVPLTKRARTIIAARHKTHGHLSGPFSMFSKNSMRHRWDAMRATLGLDDVSPHTLRHTCCTRLVLGGVDIKRVMEWMGHDTISTTMRYMQIKPNSLEEIVHVLEGKPPKPVSRKKSADDGDLAEAA